MVESVQVWTEVVNCAWLTLLIMESPCDDNKHVLDNLIRFLEGQGSCFFDIHNSSYAWLKLLLFFCLSSVQIWNIGMFDLVSFEISFWW